MFCIAVDFSTKTSQKQAGKIIIDHTVALEPILRSKLIDQFVQGSV